MKNEAKKKIHDHYDLLTDEDREKLIAFLDGELNSDAKKETELHLSKCKACRNELASLKATLKLIQADEIPHFAPLAWQIRQKRTAPWWRWVLIPVAATAGVLALLITGGDHLFLPQPSADQDWVEVAGESLSVDEGLQLASMLIMSDEKFKEELIEYSESMPGDIYSDLEDLNTDEQNALISLLEEMMAPSKGVSI